MMQKRIKTAFISVLAFCSGAAAQVPEGFTTVDSLIFTRRAVIDTTLYGRDIFAVMPLCVNIYQPDIIRQAVADRIVENEASDFRGYRIRIFFDNSQNARNASSSVLYRFKIAHPGISAYRTFDSPNFKVTVGDFRTRSEALAALKEIQAGFPSAFIVRENFKFPAFPGEDEFRTDTLKVLRKL